MYMLTPVTKEISQWQKKSRNDQTGKGQLQGLNGQGHQSRLLSMAVVLTWHTNAAHSQGRSPLRASYVARKKRNTAILVFTQSIAVMPAMLKPPRSATRNESSSSVRSDEKRERPAPKHRKHTNKLCDMYEYAHVTELVFL